MSENLQVLHILRREVCFFIFYFIFPTDVHSYASTTPLFHKVLPGGPQLFPRQPTERRREN